jgi:hypothetical protein
MVISDDRKFIFVHIPKTAGSSLARALRPEGNPLHPLCLPGTQHETLNAFRSRVGEEALEGYRIFTVVRDPLQRLISHYRYLKSNPSVFPEMREVDSLDEYVAAIERGDMTVIRKTVRILAQHMFVTLENGDPPVEIFRYEDMDAQFSSIFAYLGLKVRPLPKVNVSTAERPSVSEKARQFARSFYAKDYELFGY